MARLLYASIAAALMASSPAFAGGERCPAGWTLKKNVRVTGCCTPVEDEYRSEQAFKKAVKVEGWGRRSDGSYLGWYDGGWHTANFPMNAHGGEQGHMSLAADRSFLPQGARVVIPKISGDHVYTVDDYGPGIEGRMVNRWLGEGRRACNQNRNRTTFICVKD